MATTFLTKSTFRVTPTCVWGVIALYGKPDLSM